MKSTEDKIDLRMGRDEALVLFEMLHEFYDQPVLTIGSSSERLALVRLHGMLEKVLVEPFMPNYETLIADARSRLGEHAGDSRAGDDQRCEP
jgi:hypothetical protein